MRSDVRRVLLVAGMTGAASIGLCGCTGPHSIDGPVSIAEFSTRAAALPDAAITTPAPVPTGSLEDPFLEGPRVGWLDDGERFAITLGGSTSCYPVPTGISTPTTQRIELNLEMTGGSDCTADLVLWTHVLRTPDGVEPSTGVEVIGVGNAFGGVLPPLGAPDDRSMEPGRDDE